RHPVARFLMVGRGNTWDNLELLQWIEQAGLKEKFVLLGERSDVPVCLSAMDIFCLHSKTEGFPNVLGEAMAMRVPCVATDVGDTRLLMGGLGQVVQVNAIDISAGVDYLLNQDVESLTDLKERSYAHLRDHYSLSY